MASWEASASNGIFSKRNDFKLNGKWNDETKRGTRNKCKTKQCTQYNAQFEFSSRFLSFSLCFFFWTKATVVFASRHATRIPLCECLIENKKKTSKTMTIYLIKTFPILLITVNGIEHCLRICNTKFAKTGTNKHYIEDKSQFAAFTRS